MMGRNADVRSIDALRSFRAALREYADTVQEVLTDLQLESRRTIDWVQNDRLPYWKRQVNRSRDALDQAMSELDIKQMTFDGGPQPAFVEQREAVRQARSRLQIAEQRVATIRKLIPALHHEVDEYHGVIGKLAQLIESDLPMAMTRLTRMIDSLNQYSLTREPAPKPSSGENTP